MQPRQLEKKSITQLIKNLTRFNGSLQGTFKNVLTFKQMLIFPSLKTYWITLKVTSSGWCSVFVSTTKRLHHLMFRKCIVFSHTVYYQQFYSLSVWALCFSASLSRPLEKPRLLWLVSSHRPEQLPPTVGRAVGGAEGGDCIVVTSALWIECFNRTTVYVAARPALLSKRLGAVTFFLILIFGNLTSLSVLF